MKVSIYNEILAENITLFMQMNKVRLTWGSRLAPFLKVSCFEHNQ